MREKIIAQSVRAGLAIVGFTVASKAKNKALITGGVILGISCTIRFIQALDE